MNGTLTRCRALVALLGALSFASASQAQTDDISQTVARVAYFSGGVSYSRGDDPDNWQPASLNFPMTLGDRLYTARGSRLELQTEGGVIYLAPETDLAALNLTYDVKQFSLGIGSASFLISRLDSGESFEVDTPNSAVTFDHPGKYRIDVDRDGNTRVIVDRGHAYVAAAGGEVPLETGQMMAIDGIDSPVYDVMSLPRRDSWDQWVATRSRRFRDTGSRRYVNPDISGVDDLDQYGRWSQVPGYGTCWSPANVSAGWQPYRAGRWAWQDPWGWSWVSNEPWGWAPYHYGRWVTSQSRWYWVPVGPDVRTVRYAPALVAFVGGPGFSLSVSMGGGGPRGGGGYVGWFPLAPRDPFVPWWGSGARTTNVTNVTYVNRTYVTVVNQNTFISGAPVGTNVIRDARTVREISAAPVVRGPIQIVPLASSIRVSTGRAGSAPRPPAAALSRAVVTRLAPPPAPAPFHEKAHLIKENRGAPVTAAEAARLPVTNQAIRPTRSAVVEGGHVTLAPKKTGGVGPAPVPVTRAIPPGQARREAQPPGVREVSAGQAKGAPASERQEPAVDTRKQQQQAEEARKAQQQQAEGARKTQQQQAVDTQKKQQQAEEARKQQQQQAEGARGAQQQQAVDTQKKQQQAEEARKQQQQAEGARKAQQQQAVDTQKKQQQAEEARKQQQQQAEGARKAQQQQAVDTQKKQQQAEEARKQQQQQAEGARKAQQQQQAVDTQKKQQQAEEARKQQQQQAEGARKAQQQQQAVDTQKKQQQAEEARKQQQQQAEGARKAQQQQQAVDTQKRQQQADAKAKQDAEKQKAAEDQKKEKEKEKEKKQPADEEKH